jgi:hypothetical protein
VALAVAGSAGGPTAAGAQRAAEVLPAGARVQLFFPGRAAEVRGVLMRPGGDTLWVRYDGAPDTAAIRRAGLRELRVSGGRRPRRVGRGMAVGLLAGAAVGGVLGAALATRTSDGYQVFGGTGETARAFAMLGAVPGAVIGALVGMERREVWLRVPLRAGGA